MAELIRVERYISCFSFTDDYMKAEINVDSIPLEKLLLIVIANDDDQLLYDCYPLSENQLNQINNLLPEKIDFDLKSFMYNLECGGIYDYQLKK